MPLHFVPLSPRSIASAYPACNCDIQEEGLIFIVCLHAAILTLSNACKGCVQSCRGNLCGFSPSRSNATCRVCSYIGTALLDSSHSRGLPDWECTAKAYSDGIPPTYSVHSVRQLCQLCLQQSSRLDIQVWPQRIHHKGLSSPPPFPSLALYCIYAFFMCQFHECQWPWTVKQIWAGPLLKSQAWPESCAVHFPTKMCRWCSIVKVISASSDWMDCWWCQKLKFWHSNKLKYLSCL